MNTAILSAILANPPKSNEKETKWSPESPLKLPERKLPERNTCTEKAVAHISPESVYLMSDSELNDLLYRRGVDTSRRTRITAGGSVFYIDNAGVV